MSWSFDLKICTLSFMDIWDGNIHSIQVYFYLFILLLQFPSKGSVGGTESHEILLCEIGSLPVPNIFFSVPFTLKLLEYTDHIKGLRSFSNGPVSRRSLNFFIDQSSWMNCTAEDDFRCVPLNSSVAFSTGTRALGVCFLLLPFSFVFFVFVSHPAMAWESFPMCEEVGLWITRCEELIAPDC